MSIADLLSTGLLVAGALAAIAALWNTQRKRAQRATRQTAPPPQDDDLPASTSPVDDLRDPAWRKRLAAVRALDADDERRNGAVFALVPLLNDPDGDVREAVITALAKCGKLAVPGVVDTLSSATSVNAREGAARSLGLMGGAGGATAQAALVAALDDPSAWVRMPAAQALGRLRASQAVDALIQRLRDEDAGVRSAAAEALKAIATPDALAAVESL